MSAAMFEQVKKSGICKTGSVLKGLTYRTHMEDPNCDITHYTMLNCLKRCAKAFLIRLE
jgi:hypothetical protein